MKLYIADKTCSEAVQIIANELGITPELIHFDVFGKSTSNGDDFAELNPMQYVPLLVLDEAHKERLSETIVVTSYLADQYPEAGLIPPQGTLERVKYDQLLVFIATEIAQKHIPLMRKLMTEAGIAWTSSRIIAAYQILDDRLSDGRPYLAGDTLTVADAYLWATFWGERSGINVSHLANVTAWKARMDAHPSVLKALRDEADVVNAHRALIAEQTV
ncbi:glutathione S-transferase family protein [Sodalis ligni]|uniref:glutathione S-transferase family protein n=1 Tax=Sodalis ligni TaxID=2697027 RepID=UPI0019400DAB|nr:glutathione S-transferase C-terminal domain-containing protein [Sodalis ligni]QWA11620.1 glutathione S-transferase family protein [Sodalis ligni]